MGGRTAPDEQGFMLKGVLGGYCRWVLSVFYTVLEGFTRVQGFAGVAWNSNSFGMARCFLTALMETFCMLQGEIFLPVLKQVDATSRTQASIPETLALNHKPKAQSLVNFNPCPIQVPKFQHTSLDPKQKPCAAEAQYRSQV